MKHKSNDPFAPFQNAFPGAAPATQAFKLWISFFPVAPMFGVRWVFEEAMQPAAQTATAAATEVAAKAAETTREATEAAAEQSRQAVEQSAEAMIAAAERMTAAPSEGAPQTVAEASGTLTGMVTDTFEATGKAANDAAETATKAAAETATEAATEAVDAAAEVARTLPPKPATLMDSAPERPDDLKLIKGIGPGLESKLNGLGVYTFEQIAKFTEDDLVWIDENLTTFKGRCFRDDWVGQAQGLRG